jgi:hypothetical protein
VLSSYNYEDFGGGVAATGAGRFSPALKNGLSVALFFAYAIGFSLMFERALGTLAQDNAPPPVIVVGP